MKFKCFSCFRSQSNDGVGKPRELYFGNQTLNSDKFFPTNFISTSKYTLLTFLPVALLLQFRRYANIYFLITAILQTVPQISPLTPATAWIPLIFVLGLSMVREGIEDYNRHKSDLELNSMICSVYREGSFQKVQWADVIVGDIVLCEEQETFPSDLVVLATSLENGNCYIETSSLDGEKNLKPKLAPKETSDKFIKQGDKAIFRLEGKISCEAPNPSLHSFSGTFSMRNLKVSLGVKQLLLRGAVLKNTKWILGIAVYTGLETRIMLNSNPSRYKQSQIEKRTNNLILLVFSLQLVCCLICAVCAGYFYMNNENAPYLYKIYGTALEGFLNYFTYFLLNNTMIPISLIVSLEMVKMLQAFFIQGDTDLYDLEKNRYAKAFTTSINEELGQIEYIFSDKTGTLTCNKMEFKLAMIGTEMYGDRRILKEKSSIQRKPTYVDKKEGVVFSFEDKKLDALMRREWELTGSEYPLIQNTNLSYEIKNSVTNETVYVIKTQYDLANEFFKLLSTCHECVIDSEKNKDMNMIRYQGPSPDEITLVDTARHLGFTFLGSSTTAMQVEWLGQKQTIDLLKLFEFNSDRKRMSVIIRENGIIKLYCKGADSIMKERLTTHHPQPFLAEIDKKLDDFSKRGLRTLVLAFKILSEKEYEEFNKQYNALVEHEQREKEISINILNI